MVPLRPLSPKAVTAIAARALHRANVDSPIHGAHVLRHSAATYMLRQGASLPSSGAVPRHASVETTAHDAKARRLGPSESIRPHTYSTLFGLLAVTGMHVAEALALHLTDVTVGGLLIRHTKFKKSRLLPLHATTRAALDDYLAQRQQHGWYRRASLCLMPSRPALPDRGDADVSPGAHGRRHSP